MKKIFILTLILVASVISVFSQEHAKDVPYSFTQRNLSANIDKVVLPHLNNDALIARDAERVSDTKTFRVGVGHDVSYTMKNCGRTDMMEDGSKLWRIYFTSEDAIMMSAVFDIFNIPEQGRLFMYSPNKEQVFGPYTNDDIQQAGKVVTDNIVGDEMVIEYYEPADADFKGDFRIAALMHSYRDFLHVNKEARGTHGDAEGNCHINVICPEGDNWREPIKSVVCMEMTANTSEGWIQFLCTGATVNNVRMDKKLYVLSANHCIESTSQTYKFHFNYQTFTCNGTDGSSRTVNGGKIIARSSTNSDNYNANSDFLLLEITGFVNPIIRDSIFFAGWDRSGLSSIGAGIHHPGGDWKKISIPRTVTTITSGNLKDKYFDVYWMNNPNKGVTEQGSSGSPLFNNHSLIIGTLTAGSSECSGLGLYSDDYYGRMAYHWYNNNATSNEFKLQPWLDPDNTGVTSLPGMHYNGTIFTGVNNYDDNHSFSVSPNPANGSFVTIQGEFLTEKAVCNVYNVMGQLVKSTDVETAASFQLNVANLQDGIYMVEIIGSERNYKSKLVIAR